MKWYLNFNIDMSQVPEGATKIPFIQMPQSSGIWASIENDTAPLTHAEIEGFGFLSRAEIQQMAEDSPGSYWYVFGEPNRYGYMDGDRFAPVFEYFRTYLLAGDSTAKIISPASSTGSGPVTNWEWTCYHRSTCGRFTPTRPQLGVDLLPALRLPTREGLGRGVCRRI